jgi:CHRD domain
LLLGAAVRVAQAERIQATLTGFEEVPSVSTAASGEFRGFINRDEQSIDFELRYSGLQGTVQQAHIHVAQLSVNGSIVIWLCQTATPFLDPAGLAGQCQAGQNTEAVITGTITAANVIAGSTTQQLGAGELDEVIAAIRAGAAYANVHTNLSPGGEIRGQIRASRRR